MATAVNLSLSTESFPPHHLTHYTLTIPTFPPPYHHPHSTTTFNVRFSLSFFSLRVLPHLLPAIIQLEQME